MRSYMLALLVTFSFCLSQNESANFLSKYSKFVTEWKQLKSSYDPFGPSAEVTKKRFNEIISELAKDYTKSSQDKVLNYFYSQIGDSNEVESIVAGELLRKIGPEVIFFDEYSKWRKDHQKLDLIIFMLAESSNTMAKKIFISEISNPQASTRLSSAEGLNKPAYRGDKTVIDALVKQLNVEQHDSVAQSICAGLVTIMDKNAIPILEKVRDESLKGRYGNETYKYSSRMVIELGKR